MIVRVFSNKLFLHRIFLRINSLSSSSFFQHPF